MPFLRIDETQSLYYVWKPVQRDGLTILIIHGLGSSSSFYAPILPSLADKGYSCLAFDTPGSGLSSYCGHDRTPSEISQIASTLINALELHPERIVAVGHSMGALVACELGLRHALRGVVLLGPVHPSSNLADIFAARIKAVEKHHMEVLADSIPIAATGTKSTPTHHAFIRALLLSQSPEGCVSLRRTNVNATPPCYGQIDSPLLIVAGLDDKTSPLEGCNTIMKSWGNDKLYKQLETLEGVGHWHCIEAA